MISVKVSGLQELSARFENLCGEQQDELVKQCFEKGARVIQNDVQATAPHKSGLLASRVIVATTKTRKGQVVTKVQMDRANYKGDAFYAAFQEFGWHAGKRSKGNDRPFIQGKHFFRQAMIRHTSDVPQQIAQDIANAIERLDQTL